MGILGEIKEPKKHVISVVGNARSIFLKKHGLLIDSSNMIVRFNHGVVRYPRSQGSRTDVIVQSYLYRHLKYFRGAARWNTATFKERETLEKILQCKPSNGIVALEKIKNEYPNSRVMIHGFDWKETPTFYHRRSDASNKEDGHDYVKEKEYCLNLIETMGWELY